MGFALIVYWSVLAFTEMIVVDTAAFSANLTSTSVQQGYLTTLRGLLLLLIFVAVGAMTALLRRGLVIAPLIWIAQVLRIAFVRGGPTLWRNMLFVSDLLNLVLFLLLPVVLALILWQSLDYIDVPLGFGGIAVPALWLLLTALSSAGNLFVWYWSLQLGLGVWPSGYGLIPLVAGLIFFIFSAGERPRACLGLFFSGYLLPAFVCTVIWGWYDGLGLALLSFMPWGNGGLFIIWLGLMALVALPLLVALVLNQFSARHQGKDLLEII